MLQPKRLIGMCIEVWVHICSFTYIHTYIYIYTHNMLGVAPRIPVANKGIIYRKNLPRPRRKENVKCKEKPQTPRYRLQRCGGGWVWGAQKEGELEGFILLMAEIRHSPVEVGSLPRYSPGFIHPRWWSPDFFHQQHGIYRFFIGFQVFTDILSWKNMIKFTPSFFSWNILSHKPRKTKWDFYRWMNW